MRINIPKVIVPVDMGDYAAELAGQRLFVWVNPSREKLQEYNDMVSDLQAEELEAARKTLTDGQAEADPFSAQTPLARTLDQVTRWMKLKKNRKIEGLNPKLMQWYAEIWSQGESASHWSADELKKLEGEDPAFLSWMISQTWQSRSEHIDRKKKV